MGVYITPLRHATAWGMGALYEDGRPHSRLHSQEWGRPGNEATDSYSWSLVPVVSLVPVYTIGIWYHSDTNYGIPHHVE